eukprot:361525-Chlamydomonas_euryale.AAC.17
MICMLANWLSLSLADWTCVLAKKCRHANGNDANWNDANGNDANGNDANGNDANGDDAYAYTMLAVNSYLLTQLLSAEAVLVAFVARKHDDAGTRSGNACQQKVSRIYPRSFPPHVPALT